eukprot:g5307.t1
MAKQSSRSSRSRTSKKDPYALVSLGNIDFAHASAALGKEQHRTLSSDTKQRLQASLLMFKKVLDQDGKNAYAANGIGMVLAELGHREKAAKIFSAVNETMPNMLQSRVNLAHLHMSNGRYAAACQLYELCAERCLPEKRAEYLMCLARAQTSAGKSETTMFDAALETMGKIKDIAPNDPNLGFNHAIVKYTFGSSILEKARAEWAEHKDKRNYSFRYYTLSWIRRANDMMESALKQFEAAKAAIEEAGDDADAQGFLFNARETKERLLHTKELLAKTIPAYLAHAEDADKKDEAARKLAQKKLADQERQEALARREDKERADREQKEREEKANELMRKAMDQNLIEARESKAVKEKKARRKSVQRKTRDRGETLGSDSDRSEDTSSESDSDSDSDSDRDDGGRASEQSHKRSAPGPASASPAKKKIRKSRLEMFSSESESDDDDDDDILMTSKPANGADAATRTGGTPASAPSSVPASVPAAAPAASTGPAGRMAAMMDDDDEDD